MRVGDKTRGRSIDKRGGKHEQGNGQEGAEEIEGM